MAGRCCGARHRGAEVRSAQEHAHRPRQRGRPRLRARDPGAARASGAPRTAFLGEEGGYDEGTSGLTWVVDPLDGTINFLFGIPQWCVSVAVRDGTGTLAGAVYDPNRDELFTATQGRPPALARRGRRGELRAGRGPAGRRRWTTGSRNRHGRHRLRLRRRRARRAGAGAGARRSRACATSAASAAPHSTSPGRPPGATTPTSSAPSSSGTSPPAR